MNAPKKRCNCEYVNVWGNFDSENIILRKCNYECSSLVWEYHFMETSLPDSHTFRNFTTYCGITFLCEQFPAGGHQLGMVTPLMTAVVRASAPWYFYKLQTLAGVPEATPSSVTLSGRWQQPWCCWGEKRKLYPWWWSWLEQTLALFEEKNTEIDFIWQQLMDFLIHVVRGRTEDTWFGMTVFY